MAKGNKGFQKGEGGRHKGSKNAATIAKDERRAIFDEEVSKVFIEKIHAARPEYVLDQFMDKAKEKIEVEIGASDPIIEALANKLDELYGK